ncbi:MAG: endonuclease III [Candidatus Aenigmatarchaeota archaeon]|nr:MAG: endonuclease III [Candidatus Aenigmarchaeota archaeon]RLJ07918.1 MAG: endonuclease III [Candidatus Aenigmarchaeota archaeon]RLJ09156.1 MAG: endonuclease III [Candidatus Aenigmarchaeota archaeon]
MSVVFGSMDKEKANKMLEALKKAYPNPHHYIIFENPFQLLIATVLSAQCKDEIVNETTKMLFKKFKKPEDFMEADLKNLEKAIKSVTFAKNKAKHIKKLCEILVNDFNGKVPETMEELVKFPGIGRKSANAILQHAFNKIEGIVVDTHVIRVSYRMGWTNEKNPEKIEKDLMKLFDKKDWKWIQFYLKSHGRSVCKPKPKCNECFLRNLCPKAGVK